MANEPSRRKAREGLRVNVRTRGIDLAKNVFRVHGVDVNGKIVVLRQLRRRQLLPFMAQLKPCLVGMEACGGAHHFAREIAKQGHEVYALGSIMTARDAKPSCPAEPGS
jgi:transposase